MLREADIASASARVVMAQVQTESRNAAAVLSLCSFLAAEDIPRRLLFYAPAAVPEEQRGAFESASVRESIQVLERRSLVRAYRDAIAVHRDLQAGVRKTLPPPER